MRAVKLWAIVVFLALLTISGCVQKGSQNSVSIMFAGRPMLFEDAVYYNGTVVGKIVALQLGQGNVARVEFVPLEVFRDRLADNMVFFVDSGRLNIAKIKNFGFPVAKGQAFLGLNSKAAFYWFKVKHALGDAGLAASMQAGMLSDQFRG